MATDKSRTPTRLPKTGKDVAQEGTDLAVAGDPATGGNVPFLTPRPVTKERVWATDDDANVNLRGTSRATPGDVVEETR